MAQSARKQCNVCGAPAAKTCSRCKCRFYCGAKCQKEDWRLHRRYCTPPATQEETIRSLKRTWTSAGFDDEEWDDLLDEVKDKHGGKADPEALESAVMHAMKQQCLAEGAPEDWFKADDVPYTLEYVKQLGTLPQLPLVDDEFVVSFSTFGDVNRDGQLLYATMTMSNATEQPRYHGTCVGKPSLADAESVLFGAMFKPMPFTGPRARPSHVLLAHRWGSEVFAGLQPFLQAHGVNARLESRQEAEHSANLNGVDEDGNNF